MQGYIVGGRYEDFDQPWNNDRGISIADNENETNVDNALQIKLESSTGHRELWGLNNNPSVFGTLIKVHGFRDTYGGNPSFEGVDEIREVGSKGDDEDQEPSNHITNFSAVSDTIIENYLY